MRRYEQREGTGERCLCCQRKDPVPTARIQGRKWIHLDCWMEHHSSPVETHGCPVDRPPGREEER